MPETPMDMHAEANAEAPAGGGAALSGVVEPAARIIEPDGGGHQAGFLLAAGIVVVTATLLMRGKRLRLRRAKRDRVADAETRMAAPALSPSDAQAVAEASRARLVNAEREARSRQTLEALMVEVQELTRVCAGQIENRAVRLERLIAEADARLGELRLLESRHGDSVVREGARAREVAREKAAGSGLGRGEGTGGGKAQPAVVSTRSVRGVSRSTGRDAMGAEPMAPEALRSASVLTAGRDAGDGNSAGALDPLTRRVYELADRGLSSLDIARRLEEQMGKVELILSLRRG